MDVTLQYFDGCPNWQLADQRLRTVLGNRAAIEYILVESLEDAERLGFTGSPTVLVNGVDPFAEPDAPFAFACRVYRTKAGPDHSPSVAQLQDALGVAA